MNLPPTARGTFELKRAGIKLKLFFLTDASVKLITDSAVLPVFVAVDHHPLKRRREHALIDQRLVYRQGGGLVPVGAPVGGYEQESKSCLGLQPVMPVGVDGGVISLTLRFGLRGNR